MSERTKPEPKDMDAAEFRSAIAKIAPSPYAAAPVIGISVRQAQRMAADEIPVPKPVRKLLRLAAKFAAEAKLEEL